RASSTGRPGPQRVRKPPHPHRLLVSGPILWLPQSRVRRPLLGLPHRQTRQRLLLPRRLLYPRQLLFPHRLQAGLLPRPPAPPALPLRQRQRVSSRNPPAARPSPGACSTRPRFSARTERPSSSSPRSSRPAIAGAFLSPLRGPSACTSRAATRG